VLARLIVEHARRGAGIVLTSHLALPIDDPAPLVVELREPALA
jgi:ABC-type transport system involved in cytochrome c biogenesis ATPase subunit